MRNAVVASLIAAALIASAGAGYFAGNANQRTTTLVSTTTLTSTLVQTTTSNPCAILGQPAGMFLRVASDNSDTTIAGAQVTAIHKQADDYCNGILYPGQITTTSFTTNGTTAWYSLDSTNAGFYFFEVLYSGHDYNFSAGLRPITTTCAALFVPSGRSNITLPMGGTACP